MLRWRGLLLLLIVLLGPSTAGCKALTGETLGENIDDTNITTAVKAKLAAESGVTLTRVHVQTRKGVIFLTGSVDNPALKERAGEIARKVGGVHDVVNNVKVER